MDECGIYVIGATLGLMSISALNGIRLQRKEDSLKNRAESEASVINFGQATLVGLSDVSNGEIPQSYLSGFVSAYRNKIRPLWTDIDSYQTMIEQKEKTLTLEYANAVSRFKSAVRGLENTIRHLDPCLSLI